MLRTTIGLLLILGVVACGDEEKEPEQEPVETVDEPVYCDAPLPADPYRDGIEKETEQGMFRLRIMASDPAPPSKGTNTITMQVESADGAMVDDATVVVSPWMPHHRHGTAPADYAAQPQGGDGMYDVPGFYLFMPGYWQYKTKVTLPDGTEDETLFAFCVDG